MPSSLRITIVDPDTGERVLAAFMRREKSFNPSTIELKIDDDGPLACTERERVNEHEEWDFVEDLETRLSILLAKTKIIVDEDGIIMKDQTLKRLDQAVETLNGFRQVVKQHPGGR